MKATCIAKFVVPVLVFLCTTRSCLLEVLLVKSTWLYKAPRNELPLFVKPFWHCISYPRRIQPWGGPKTVCTQHFTLAHFHTGPYFPGFKLHISRTPQGFTTYPFSRAGVATPRGLPVTIMWKGQPLIPGGQECPNGLSRIKQKVTQRACRVFIFPRKIASNVKRTEGEVGLTLPRNFLRIGFV